MSRLLALLTTVSIFHMTAFAGTPLENALAASQAGPLYTFTLNLTADGIDAVMAVDPTMPEGERLTVVSPPEAEWTEDFADRVEKMKENTKGEIWCSELAENIPADAKLAVETDKTATYTYTPQPGPEPDDMDKIFKYLTGTVVVDKTAPAILSMEMVAKKPFKPMPVAKIKKFEMKIACQRAPDGRTHIASLDVNLSGSAMLQSFSQSDHQTITNLQPVPDSGTTSD